MTVPERHVPGIIASKGSGELAEFSWGQIEWLFNGKLAPGAEQTLGYVEIEPHQKNPLHTHPNCEELLFLVEGSLDHSLDGAVYQMRPGQAIRVPAGAKHDAHNTGKTIARMIIVYSDPARQMVVHEEGMS